MNQEIKEKEVIKKPKGLIGRWMEKLDKKMEEKSKKSGCCGSSKKGSSCC